MPIDHDPARRVVEEPRRDLWPYVVAGLGAAILCWSIMQPGLEDDRPSAESGPVPEMTRRSKGPKSATGDIRGVFSADDYPASAQQKGQEGRVQAQLSIDARGRVSACRIVRSSQVAALDDATCSILRRRARFAPAHDGRGRAIPDTVTTPPIVWRLEG